MNRNHQILFSLCLLLFSAATLTGQESDSRTYKETFNVSSDAVLDINTSHADIEFETWDKNQVEITAVVELEDATKEEAERFFEDEAVKIVGNSKEIQVSTPRRGFNFVTNGDFDYSFNFVTPDIQFVEPLFEDLNIPELPEVIVLPDLPPMPPIPHIEFDYDAYKKDGDKYLKEWKKEFDKNFDDEYQSRFKEWSERLKEKAEAQEQRRQEVRERREALREERDKLREQVRAKREEERALREKIKEKYKSSSGFRVHVSDDDEPNVFYFSSDGEGKQYKVKKRIKVKMPKSVKLKMNVRHGEVKLAANTRNINASLSYASLLASTIDGQRTSIRASYSPVEVQRWNYGQLKTDYSDNVKLKEVRELKLNSVSSNVLIEKLESAALVSNNFGELRIQSVGDNFTNIDISVENGEVDFALPKAPFSIYVNETTSDFKYPKVLSIETSKNFDTNVYKGYHIKKGNNKSININSKYSEVVLRQ